MATTNVFAQGQVLLNQGFRLAQAQAKILTTGFDLTIPYEQAVFDDNPLAFFRQDEASGTTAVNSVKSSENGTYSASNVTYNVTHGTIWKSTRTAVQYASSAQMTATIAAISATTGHATTVEFWTKGGSSNGMPFAWNVAHNDFFYSSATQMGFNRGASDIYGVNPGGARTVWSHYVWVSYHGQNYNVANKIYINGVQQSLSQLAGSSGTFNVATSFIQSGWTSSNQFWTGNPIHYLAIYDGDLSSTRVAAHYDASSQRQFAQAQAKLNSFDYPQWAQAQALLNTGFGFSQAQAKMNAFDWPQWGQAQADILQTYNKFAQAQSTTLKSAGYANSQADILQTYQKYSQAQCRVKQTYLIYAQAQAIMNQAMRVAQAQAKIGIKVFQLITATGTSTAVTTGTITPNFADSLFLVGIHNTGNVVPTSVTGIGLTFDMVASRGYFTGASPSFTVSVWRAKGTASSNTLTANYAASRSVDIHVSEWVGVNTKGSNGASAIVQSATNFTDSSTGVNVTLSAFANSNNAAYNAGAGTQGPLVVDPTGWVELAETVFTEFFQTQYYLAEDTTVFEGKNAAPSGLYGSVALEVSVYDHVNQGYALAQTKVFSFTSGVAQAQADIKNTYQGYSQSQADIDQIYSALSQGQADIIAVNNAFGQAQADVLQTYQQYAQAQADILVVYQGYAQAQVDILTTYNGLAQSQADILSTIYGWGQAQCDIKTTYYAFNQAQADIKVTSTAFAQSQADVLVSTNQFAQAQADVKQTSNAFAQAQADIFTTVNKFAQAQGNILTSRQHARPASDISNTGWVRVVL